MVKFVFAASKKPANGNGAKRTDRRKKCLSANIWNQIAKYDVVLYNWFVSWRFQWCLFFYLFFSLFLLATDFFFLLCISAESAMTMRCSVISSRFQFSRKFRLIVSAGEGEKITSINISTRLTLQRLFVFCVSLKRIIETVAEPADSKLSYTNYVAAFLFTRFAFVSTLFRQKINFFCFTVHQPFGPFASTPQRIHRAICILQSERNKNRNKEKAVS